MSGHYSLDVDPDGIETAARDLRTLAEHLQHRAEQVQAVPGGIPTTVWTGAARTAICTEMTALGVATGRFAGHLQTAATALTALAGSCREALTDTVPGLNRRWQAAQDNYTAQVRAADARTATEVADLDRTPTSTGTGTGSGGAITVTTRRLIRQDLAETNAYAHTAAAAERAAAVRRVDADYQHLLTGLHDAFQRAGRALAGATLVAVPDSTVATFIAGGGSGALPGWCSPQDGVFPPDLHAELALEPGLPLLHAADAAADAATVSAYLTDWVRHPGPMDPYIAGILARRADDPAFAAPVVRALGPAGLSRAIHGVAALQWTNADDPGAAHAEVQALQDSTAGTLAHLLGAASRAPGGLPATFAADLVTQDPQTAAILFSYADRADVAFGGQFMHAAATALVDRETPDPSIWRDVTGDPAFTFGTHFDATAAHDPTLAFLRAADNSVESAQAVLGDHTLLNYFLTQQPGYLTGRGEATADLLRAATIDHARDPVPAGTDPHDSTAFRAADIASWAVHDAAGARPLPQTRLALAGILATYLPDTYRAMSGDDRGGPGVYDHTGGHWPVGVRPGDGWPDYGIDLTRSDLRAALTAVGGDEGARKLIAQSATGFTAILLDRGAAAEAGWDPAASHAQGSPFVTSAQDSAKYLGLMIDGLAQGDIAGAKDEAERRKQIADLLSLATGYLPLDELTSTLGPGKTLADYLIDNAKDAATKGFVGDGVALATQRGNTDWGTTRDTLTLQVLDAARAHDMLTPSDRTYWPTGAQGALLPVNQMTADQRQALLQDTGRDQGYTAAARGAIDNSQQAYLDPFGD